MSSRMELSDKVLEGEKGGEGGSYFRMDGFVLKMKLWSEFALCLIRIEDFICFVC